MKILFIAPLPPPTHGQSLASAVLLKSISSRHEVAVVNQAKPKRPVKTLDQLERAREVFSFLAEAIKKKKGAELVYLSLSESFFGNVKDILFYIICFRKLRNTYIHMLGGAGMKRIIDGGGIMYRINKFFISRVKGVFVEASAQRETFRKVIEDHKIHIVPNFAEDFLFVSEDQIRSKFAVTSPLRILFLSNTIYGKGHLELMEAYLQLPQAVKDKIEITFVGGFQSDELKDQFLKKIEPEKGLIYYGKFAGGEEKLALYNRSHLFALPTYYPYEGQPISILEAYATGCVVITTLHSGIPDVFTNEVNGFAVLPRSPESIREELIRISEKTDKLFNIAVSNRNTAFQRYRTAIFTESLERIMSLR